MTFHTLIEFLSVWLTPQHVVEAVSAVFGLCGAFLLAVKSRWAGWAFVLWLFSNVGWMGFAWMGGHWFLLAQHLAFAATSLIGIYTWRVLEVVGGALNDDGLGDE